MNLILPCKLDGGMDIILNKKDVIKVKVKVIEASMSMYAMHVAVIRSLNAIVRYITIKYYKSSTS